MFGRFWRSPRAVADDENGVLEARTLRKRYASRWVVDGVSIILRPREIVGLLGPNGAGKTVTFSVISGMIVPDDGRVLLNGEDVTALPMHLRARRGIAYLPQERSVFRGLTVEENVAAVLETRGARKHDARRRAREILHRFGLSRVADSEPPACRAANNADWKSHEVLPRGRDSCCPTNRSPESTH